MRYLALATFAAAATLAGAPALAQSVEELTVTGQSFRNRETLSRTVSFADLDLTRQGDRQMLRARVNDTASDVCEQLNEPAPSAANLGRSCQEIARREAMGQVRLAVSAARGAAYADAAFSDPTFFAEAPSADGYGSQASATSYTNTTVTNGPVADTPQNRARYGAPMSHAGKRTAPRGN